MAAINARSFLRGHTLWKSVTPVVNRAPCSLKPWAGLPQESQGIQSSAPSRLRREPSGTPCQGKASLSHTPCKSKAGHKRSFSAHSHCGGRCLARFSFVGTAVAFTKCSFAAAAQGSPPLRPGPLSPATAPVGLPLVARWSPALACPPHHLGLSASPFGALLHPAR